jgi:hypothetical protein
MIGYWPRSVFRWSWIIQLLVWLSWDSLAPVDAKPIRGESINAYLLSLQSARKLIFLFGGKRRRKKRTKNGKDKKSGFVCFFDGNGSKEI